MKPLLALCLAILMAWGGAIAVGRKGSSDFDLVAPAAANTELRLLTTKGDIQSLRALYKNPDVLLAVTQEDILRDLIKKNPSFKSTLKIVAPLYRAVIVIVTPINSPIGSFKDLSNRRVIVDEKGSGDYYTFLKLQEKNLITPEVFHIPKKEAAAYLDLHKADAWFYIGNLGYLRSLPPKYKFIPVSDYDFPFGEFKLSDKKKLQTSYLVKSLVTTDKKEEKIPKSSLHLLLKNLLERGNKAFICTESSNTSAKKAGFIYFVCSEQVSKKKSSAAPQRGARLTIPKKLFYDNIEEIVIYPMALYDGRGGAYGTGRVIEKTKLENAVKLIKKGLRDDPDQKLIVISRGPGNRAVHYMKKIYKALKKAGIRRDILIKRVYPVHCTGECFTETTISFKWL
jgi:hypothetical protein